MYRAKGFLGQRLGCVCQTGNTEIGHLNAAVPQHHDVLRLNIPVDNAAAVCMAQCTHDLGDKMQRFAPIHLTAALHILLERNAVDQLHDNVFHVITAGYIVHRYDIGMRKLCYSPGLIPETAAKFRVIRQIALEYLHCHHAVQAMAFCFIYIGHAASADQLYELIAVIQHFSDVLIHIFSLL